MQYEEFEKQLTKVAIVFNRELSPELVVIYFEEFKGWTDLQFKSAVSKCIRECKFFPTVNEIRERWKLRQSNEAAPIKESQRLGISSLVKVEKTLDEKVYAMEVSEVRELFEGFGMTPEVSTSFVKRFEAREKLAVNLIKDIVCPNWDLQDFRTVICITCSDLGAVEVYDPKTTRLAASGRLTKKQVRTVMVSCTCEAAVYRAGDLKQKPMVIYNGERMIRRLAVTNDEQFNEVTLNGVRV